MARLTRPTFLVLIFLTISFVLYYAFQQQKYTLNDFSKYLETLDYSYSGTDSSKVQEPLIKQGAKLTDNNDPELIQKHKIENQVNALLKKKLENELKYERTKMSDREKELREKGDLLDKKLKEFEDEKKKFDDDKSNMVKISIRERNSETPPFKLKTYSFKINSDKPDQPSIDGDKNGLVLLSSVTQKFDDNDGQFKKFLTVLEGIEYPKYKTSLSLLLSDAEQFHKVDEFVASLFKSIEGVKEAEKLKSSFSKITLMHAQFIEDQFKVAKANRHLPQVQKQRRKLLARLRNFLVFHGVGSETYSLSVDSDIIELPKDLVTTFIESGKDIATLRIDMKNGDGRVVHLDYDLNSWAGNRKVPTAEQEANLGAENPDPNLFFEPGPGSNKIQFQDLSKHPQKYSIDKDDPKQTYELVSVGGAVLFAKTEIFKQGIVFPPYYVVGTKWDREDGYDGIETEGLCYQARTIGYSCWGFPNLVAYHHPS